jgi:alpha-tubulin suppressor-like RCC1 family protein
MVLCMGSHRSAGQQNKAAAFLRILICISLISFMGISAQAASTPVPQVSAGYNHTLALRSNGTVWAWGDNTSYELGLGSTSTAEAIGNEPEPVAVTGLTGTFTAVAAGGDDQDPFDSHSLALKSDGTVWAWGSNKYGQLGDAALDNDGNYLTLSGAPLQITTFPANTTIIAIAAGTGFSMALDSNGNVWVWGRNDLGQLGNGTVDSKPPSALQFKTDVAPAKIASLSNITGIAAGGYHALAVDKTNAVWAWGLDNCGQLGDNVPSSTGSSCVFATTPVVSNPLLVPTLNGVLSVAAGSYHSLAIMSNNSVEAWGANGGGQLGIGTSSDSSLPEPVSSLTSVTSVAGGSGHSVALSGTSVATWGANSLGQLGNGNTTIIRSDVPISGVLTGAAGVTAGGFYTVAWKSDGTVWAWGQNDSGQLGNGTTATDSSTPTPTPAQVASFSLTNLLGDMDNDGSITVRDALDALQFAVHLNPLPGLTSDEVLSRGNMTGTDTTSLTVQDAQIILQKAVLLIP